MKSLRLILGDQLSFDLTSLQDVDKEKDILLMCEVWDEAIYVRHRKKKKEGLQVPATDKAYQVSWEILHKELFSEFLQIAWRSESVGNYLAAFSSIN